MEDEPDAAEETKRSPKAPMQKSSEIKKLVVRFEPGGSQYKLVEELYTYFLKPLVDVLSMIHVSDVKDISLIDGYRPLYDGYEEKILRRRMQAMKKYADSVKKLETKRRAGLKKVVALLLGRTLNFIIGYKQIPRPLAKLCTSR